jgi:hypothetical protein
MQMYIPKSTLQTRTVSAALTKSNFGTLSKCKVYNTCDVLYKHVLWMQHQPHLMRWISTTNSWSDSDFL